MPRHRWFNAPFLSTTTLLPPLLIIVHGCSGPVGGPGLDSITVDDLKTDAFALADDEFLGREAGTLDELRAAAWVADTIFIRSSTWRSIIMESIQQSKAAP